MAIDPRKCHCCKPARPGRPRLGAECALFWLSAQDGLPRRDDGRIRGKMATPATYEGVEPVEEPFVRNGNVATAGGYLAAQNLCDWVMETLAGAELSRAVQASILPVGERCKAFAGCGDPAAANAAAAQAAE